MEIINEKVIRALANHCFGEISPYSNPACELNNMSYVMSSKDPVITFTVVLYTEDVGTNPVMLNCVWFNMPYFGYVLLVKNVNTEHTFIYSCSEDKVLNISDSLRQLMKRLFGDL